MANDIADGPHEGQVTAFKERIKQDAHHLITVQVPQRIIQLDQLIQSASFHPNRQGDVKQPLNIPVPEPAALSLADAASDSNHKAQKRKHTDDNGDLDSAMDVTGSRVYLLPNGPVASNPHLVDLIDIVKPLIRQLVEDANLLKMWIQFLIPRIEDGNNFGVSIQEDTLSEIRTVESEAAAYFDQISRYFMSRAKSVVKVAKYPQIEDFRRTVDELDEKEFLSLRLIAAELRNHYATLHDMMHKNMDKIKKPRSSNVENLY